MRAPSRQCGVEVKDIDTQHRQHPLGTRRRREGSNRRGRRVVMRGSAKTSVEGVGSRHGEHPPGPLLSEWTHRLSVGCLHSFGSGEKKEVWVAVQADGQQECYQSSYR